MGREGMTGGGGGAARQVGMSKKGSGRMVQAAGESKNFFFVSCTRLSAQGEENAITRAPSAFSGECGV